MPEGIPSKAEDGAPGRGSMVTAAPVNAAWDRESSYISDSRSGVAGGEAARMIFLGIDALAWLVAFRWG